MDYLIKEYPLICAVVAFLLGGFTDVVWCYWSKASNSAKPLSAAWMSVLIYVFGILYTLIIIEKSILHLASYVIGGFIGTYYTVKYTCKG